MEALNEIGWQKALAFVFWELYKKLLHWAILPPVRIFLLQIAGAKIGSDTVILDINLLNLHHHGLSRLTVGKKCFIGDLTTLDVRGIIDMGDEVTISSSVKLVTHINVGYSDHPLQKHFPTSESSIKIEKGAYLGTAAIVLPGVTVGRESVIGAGAVVTRSVAPHTLVAGVPARKIRKIYK